MLPDISAAVCQVQEEAAFHALGLLAPAEVKRFEKRMEGGCPLCATEVRATDRTASQLAHPLATAPPPSLKGRLMSRIGPAPLAPEPWLLLATQGEWKPVVAGISRKGLHYDADRNTATYLLRFDPGAVLEAHHHGGSEQCLVLEGEVEDGEIVLRTGDFQLLKPGSVHSEVRSEKGCLLLIVAAEPHAKRFV